MKTSDRILITGGGGVLGYGLRHAFECGNYRNIVSPTRAELNLLDLEATLDFFKKFKPDYIFHLASIVYGLKGNSKNQWKAITENTIINHNLFSACAIHRPKKIFFAGTVASYAYPLNNPLNEDDFLLGLPHWGEFGYACSKRYALSYLEILEKEFGVPFTYGIFTNLYGPNDRFNIETGHVIPSLVAKASMASEFGRELQVWGNPDTTRDFLFSYDAGDAAIFAMNHCNGLVNIASGESVPIKKVVEEILRNYPEISACWDKDQPVGISRRSVSMERLFSLGWQPSYSLRSGIELTIQWYKLQNKKNLRC